MKQIISAGLSKKNNFTSGISQSLAWLGFLTEHEGDLQGAIKYYKLSMDSRDEESITIMDMKKDELAQVANELIAKYN